MFRLGARGWPLSTKMCVSMKQKLTFRSISIHSLVLTTLPEGGTTRPEEAGADDEEAGADDEEAGANDKEAGPDDGEAGADAGADDEEAGADDEEAGSDDEEVGADDEVSREDLEGKVAPKIARDDDIFLRKKSDSNSDPIRRQNGRRMSEP